MVRGLSVSRDTWGRGFVLVAMRDGFATVAQKADQVLKTGAATVLTSLPLMAGTCLIRCVVY